MKELTNFLKIMSDETRLRILVLLYHHELCVCQLTGITGISQPNVSKHLARLRDLGLVEDKKEEQYSIYSLTIENKLYRAILEEIAVNLSDYPVLLLDHEKIKAADSYLDSTKKKIKG